jgi:RNA polymerase sporulation-specific sigma factor
MIVGEIKIYMRDDGAIKVSRSLKILANKINRFIDEYQSCNSDSPSIKLVAKKFDVSEEEVVMALDSSRMPLSIYNKYDDEEEGQELIDKIPHCDNEDIVVDRIHLNNIINDLNEREKKIIILRFFRDKTQSEIAECLGVSQVQVSRLENKIIDKMRLRY